MALKTPASPAKYISMYGILPQNDPMCYGFSMFSKYLYFKSVYEHTYFHYKTDAGTLAYEPDASKYPALSDAVAKIWGVSCAEELGIYLALCPLMAKDIMFAAWTSGYKTAAHFNCGKTFKALHELCIQDPDATAEALQDPDFPDLVKLTFTEGYFDPSDGLYPNDGLF